MWQRATPKHRRGRTSALLAAFLAEIAAQPAPSHTRPAVDRERAARSSGSDFLTTPTPTFELSAANVLAGFLSHSGQVRVGCCGLARNFEGGFCRYLRVDRGGNVTRVLCESSAEERTFLGGSGQNVRTIRAQPCQECSEASCHTSGTVPSPTERAIAGIVRGDFPTPPPAKNPAPPVIC